MDYSLITHVLPDAFEVNGHSYGLDTRTCRALQAYATLEEEDIPDEVRIGRVIELMLTPAARYALRRNIGDSAEVYSRIAGFLRGWPEDRKPGKRKAEEVFSYTEDHALIVAAFRQAYGIGLKELKEMHWWEFLALLSGIPDSTVLSRIMGIRAMDIDPKEPPKVKAAKRKAKEAAALKRKGGRAKTGEEIISEAFAGL